jgi:hypothetical protein
LRALRALALAALLAAGCRPQSGAEGGGMRAQGLISAIARRSVPSVMAGRSERVVARIGLDIESLSDARGAAVDKSNYVGLEFEGPAELTDRFRVGDRVAIVTTTATGMHIAKIELVVLH